MKRCPNPDCHGFIEKGARYCCFCLEPVDFNPANGGRGK